MKIEKAINPNAVSNTDKFLIIGVTHDGGTMRAIESHFTEERAQWAVRILNEHSEKYNGTMRYQVISMPEKDPTTYKGILRWNTRGDTFQA